MNTSRLVALVATVGLALPLAACTDNSEPASSAAASGAGAGPAKLAVTSTNDACEVSAQKAPSGNVVFTVQNDGSKVTEFYLLAGDGLRIIGEVENIAPGLKRDLVVKAPPGKYFTACKPGMVGQGIRNAFTVTRLRRRSGPQGQRQEAGDGRGHRLLVVRQGPDRAAAHQDDPLRQALQVRPGRRRAQALSRRARPLGADRAGGGVVRRPRPQDRQP
jgi:Cupredoxin-like domain